MAIPAALQRVIWQRAGDRCEYCHVPVQADNGPFCIDHIIAQKHHGPTISENLALACFLCNSFKLDNLSGLDPTTDLLTPRFHPRREQWNEHFEWQGAELVGRTNIGRATIDVLKINLDERVGHRKLLMSQNKFDQPTNL